MSQSLTAEHLLNLMAGWESRRGPRYLALADAIQETVHREELEDGTRLPPERLPIWLLRSRRILTVWTRRTSMTTSPRLPRGSRMRGCSSSIGT